MSVIWVASRSRERAEAFRMAFGITDGIGSYHQAVAKGGVDAVYIATPPAMHVEHATMCIEAGIPVLVEKPFATTENGAAFIADLARKRSVFAMEAMWTRFLPAAQRLKTELGATRVGDPRIVEGCFGISKEVVPSSSSFDPALGGGALAHLGVYPVSLSHWLWGEPQVIQAMATLGSSGVDEDVAFHLQYSHGPIGVFYASIRAWAPNDFRITATEGVIEFDGPIARPHGLRVLRRSPIRPGAYSGYGLKFKAIQSDLAHRVSQIMGITNTARGRKIKCHYRGNGFHYEAREVLMCLAQGRGESLTMPLDDSVAVARTIDRIREATDSPWRGAAP